MRGLLLILLLLALASMDKAAPSPKGHMFYREHAVILGGNDTTASYMEFRDSSFVFIWYIDSTDYKPARHTAKGKWKQVGNNIFLIYPDRVDTGRMMELDLDQWVQPAILFKGAAFFYQTRGMRRK